MEVKFDTQIEEIDLLQNELDNQRSHSEETIERLNQQLVELQADLEVKERELNNFKLKSSLELPAPQIEEKLSDGNRVSFEASNLRRDNTLTLR